MCVCVWGVKDQKEFRISVRKEKVKRVRGVCQAGGAVMPFVQM